MQTFVNIEQPCDKLLCSGWEEIDFHTRVTRLTCEQQTNTNQQKVVCFCLIFELIVLFGDIVSLYVGVDHSLGLLLLK